MIAASGSDDLAAVSGQLPTLDVPTLLVRRTGHPPFGITWAYRLGDMVPGVRELAEVDGARLYFPQERPKEPLPTYAATAAGDKRRGQPLRSGLQGRPLRKGTVLPWTTAACGGPSRTGVEASNAPLSARKGDHFTARHAEIYAVGTQQHLRR